EDLAGLDQLGGGNPLLGADQVLRPPLVVLAPPPPVVRLARGVAVDDLALVVDRVRRRVPTVRVVRGLGASHNSSLPATDGGDCRVFWSGVLLVDRVTTSSPNRWICSSASPIGGPFGNRKRIVK